MKKLLFTVFFATAFVTAANVRMSALGSTSPAQTFKYFGCFVHDADGVQYLDLNCKVHEVRKYDEAGNLEFCIIATMGRYLKMQPCHQRLFIRR
jgi:hypothetical protein